MNTPVNYKLAKLLKEKEFNEPCKLCVEEGDEMPLPFNCGDTIHRNSLHQYYSAPTISEVVMWLYEKHGLWTNVVYMGFELKYSWFIDIVTTSGSHWDSYGEEGDICYNSPTEAYEAAIEYTLTKLI